MKIILILTISFLLFSCHKDPVEQIDDRINQLISMSQYSELSHFLNDYNYNPDAVVNVVVSHFFHKEPLISNSKLSVKTVFSDRPDGIIKLESFGETNINKEDVFSFEHLFFCCNDETPTSNNYNLTFQTNNESYSSFNEEIYVDFEFIVNSNLDINKETGFYIVDKENDIELTWTNSTQNDKVYFSLCGTSKCIIKEADNVGTLIIDRSELSQFTTEESVVIYLLKIKQKCIVNSNKNICINSISQASPGPCRIK